MEHEAHHDLHLHVVSFNVPWPANYGGVIDVYHRLRTLAARGVQIHLHCFAYGRPPAAELEALCREVHYYERDTSPLRFLTSAKPYIVSSRHSRQLLTRLQADDHPILFEGLHTCLYLPDLRRAQPSRTLLVRAHNVEHDYYALLSRSTSGWRARYHAAEARRLRRYEPVLREASCVLAVTEADAQHFRQLGCPSVCLMPSSHPFDTFSARSGHGSYALYHADLSVPENVEAALYLADQVFDEGDLPLILAGRNPAPSVVQAAERHPNITLEPNPSDARMQQLIGEAHVCVLTTSQPTGLKLKLLQSLYGGRFCIVNSHMVAGTTLGKVCVVADTPAEMRQALHTLFAQPFTADDLNYRRLLMQERYDNQQNATVLLEQIGRLHRP